MNVLVFTSAMTEKDFATFQSEAKIKPNPSNQNFYNKLIRTLALGNNVAVVSHRPLAKGMFKSNSLEEDESVEGNLTYYYNNGR